MDERGRDRPRREYDDRRGGYRKRREEAATSTAPSAALTGTSRHELA